MPARPVTILAVLLFPGEAPSVSRAGFSTPLGTTWRCPRGPRRRRRRRLAAAEARRVRGWSAHVHVRGRGGHAHVHVLRRGPVHVVPAPSLVTVVSAVVFGGSQKPGREDGRKGRARRWKKKGKETQQQKKEKIEREIGDQRRRGETKKKRKFPPRLLKLVSSAYTHIHLNVELERFRATTSRKPGKQKRGPGERDTSSKWDNNEANNSPTPPQRRTRPRKNLRPWTTKADR